MNPVSKIGRVRITNPFLSGLVYSFIWLGAAAIVLSMLLTFSGMKEQSIGVYTYPLHALAVLLGGFVSGKRAGAKGWYHGGVMGLIYGAVVALISFLGFDAAMNLKTAIVTGVSFLAGAFGGIFGVNARK